MDTDDTEDTVHELDSGLTEEHKNRSLDRKVTRKRRSAKKLYIYVTLSFGLLCILQATLNVSPPLLMYKEEEEAPNSTGTANRTAKQNVDDACELTLDRNTAYRDLFLSEDNKTVTWRARQYYPDHPERFDYWSQVLCRESLTGRCYWEVEKKGEVFIGVTYRGITRKGGGDDSLLGWNNKSWILYCSESGYVALYNGSDTLIRLPPPGSNRVRVYVNRPAGSLSFYRVSPDVGGSSDTLTHIHTFQTTFTQEDLLPGFALNSGSSVSLSQSPARV